MGLADWMVREALYTLASSVDSRFNKKLQSIFSFSAKLSVLHFRLFTKLFSAVCKVWNVFLSTLFATLLLSTLTRALSSWAWQIIIEKKKRKKRVILCISVINNC